ETPSALAGADGSLSSSGFDCAAATRAAQITMQSATTPRGPLGARLSRGREIEQLRKRIRPELGKEILVRRLFLRRGDRVDQLVATAELLFHGVDHVRQVQELRVRRRLE